MDCKEICHLIDDYIDSYIDNKSDSAVVTSINSHLEVCPQCRKKFNEAVKISDALHEMTYAELPERFNSELREKLEKANEEMNRGKISLFRRPTFRTFVGAAAAVVVVVTGGLAISRFALLNRKSMDNAEFFADSASNDAGDFKIKAFYKNELSEGKSEEELRASQAPPGMGSADPTNAPETAATTTIVTTTMASATMTQKTAESDEQALINKINIVVKASKPEEQISRLNSFAAANGAKACNGSLNGTETTDVTQYAGAMNAISFTVDEAAFNSIKNYLIDNYSSSNISCYTNSNEQIDCSDVELAPSLQITITFE